MSLFTTITSSRWAHTISKLKKNDNSSNKKNGLNYTRHTINPVLPGGGGGHIVPALTLTNYNSSTARRIITKSRDFSSNLSEKIFCVNDVSMMIDVSIATVYSEVYFDYFLSFSVFFQVFPLRL